MSVYSVITVRLERQNHALVTPVSLIEQRVDFDIGSEGSRRDGNNIGDEGVKYLSESEFIQNLHTLQYDSHN